MLEAIIGAAVGAILGAVGTWIVSRSERLKAEEAAALASAEAAAQAANAVIAAELAQRLGSMCSPFTADTIEAEDVAKMRADWEAYAQSLRLRNFIGAISGKQLYRCTRGIHGGEGSSRTRRAKARACIDDRQGPHVPLEGGIEACTQFALPGERVNLAKTKGVAHPTCWVRAGWIMSGIKWGALWDGLRPLS